MTAPGWPKPSRSCAPAWRAWVSRRWAKPQTDAAPAPRRHTAALKSPPTSARSREEDRLGLHRGGALEAREQRAHRLVHLLVRHVIHPERLPHLLPADPEPGAVCGAERVRLQPPQELGILCRTACYAADVLLDGSVRSVLLHQVPPPSDACCARGLSAPNCPPNLISEGHPSQGAGSNRTVLSISCWRA